MILFTDTARFISTVGVARRGLDRIEQVTGCRPDEWMRNVHDTAVADNSINGILDFEAFEMQVACNVDHFIDHVRDLYASIISC